MDFRQSGQTPVNRTEPVAASQPPVAVPHVQAHVSSGKNPLGKIKNKSSNSWLSMLTVAILFGITILLVLIAFSFARSDSTSSTESKQVDNSKYQAVFLNNGQVYFGKITALNGQYINLSNIYYLTQSTSTSSSGQQQSTGDYTLVKLGCQQIHYPLDKMVINHSQVTFWENLDAKGKVVKGIEEFKQKYPNGPDCSNVSNQTQSSSNANTQGSSTDSKSSGN